MNKYSINPLTYNQSRPSGAPRINAYRLYLLKSFASFQNLCKYVGDVLASMETDNVYVVKLILLLSYFKNILQEIDAMCKAVRKISAKISIDCHFA